jgi:hypothetical protein
MFYQANASVQQRYAQREVVDITANPLNTTRLPGQCQRATMLHHRGV